MPDPILLPLSWEQFHQDCRTLAERVRGFGPFAGLVAVTRGGLVPAAILAHELGVKRVETVGITSYDGTARGHAHLVKALADPGPGWLAVDDLVDSGETARLVRTLLPDVPLAVVYAKPDGRAATDHFAVEVEQGRWIVFPWEEPPS